MDEHHPVRALADGDSERVTRAHGALGHRPLRHALGLDEATTDVEEHDVELLHRSVRERAHQLVDAPGVEAPLATLRRSPRAAAAELERRGEVRSARFADTEALELGDGEPRQLRHGAARRAGRAEHRQQVSVRQRTRTVHQQPLMHLVLGHGVLR
jgi:hypothetical protein